MKKAISLVLVFLMASALFLSGCDKLPGTGSSADFSIDLSKGEYEEGGEEGYLGDVMHTYWFNYAIDSAYTCTSYGGYTAPSDCLLLVVHMGIKSTSRSSQSMYDTDFQLWWNDDADDAYAWPITTDAQDSDQVEVDEPLSDAMFPVEYTLGINETKVGELIFQVPAKDVDGRDNKDFTLCFLEYFDTDETGDFYFIDFTAEQR